MQNLITIACGAEGVTLSSADTFALPQTFRLRTPSQPQPGHISPVPETDTDEKAAPRYAISCRRCLKTITEPEEGIQVQGAHRHTFANPGGIVFEIGCFRSAPGCIQTGAASSEFTWFNGFLWQLAACRSCLAHLGWRFASKTAAQFYGLILDRLTFPDKY